MRKSVFTVLVFLIAASALLALQRRSTPARGGEDPIPEVLRNELKAILSISRPEIYYFQAFVDLNGDGNNEVIVHMVGPALCGSGGCDTLILTPNGNSYRIMSSISLTRPPIRVLSSNSHGWKD